jgi:hypothetical protein
VSKKPLAINLQESLTVSSVVAPPAPAVVSALDAESFLKGDKNRSMELSTLVRDPRAQPRVALNTETVDAYREVMAEAGGWGPFPAVVAFGPEDGRYYLADGFHRLAAADAAGVQLGRVDVRPGGLREAILHSVGANAAHGLRRSNEDKRRAVLTLLRDAEWAAKSDRWIAEKAAVHHQLVGRLRAELGSLDDSSSDPSTPAVRLGKDGRVQNTAAIGRGRTEVKGVEEDPSLDDSSSDPEPTPETPSAVRPRRVARAVSVLDTVADALREAEVSEGKVTTHEAQAGMVALLAWAAGGDGKKAKTFLRKLGIKPPKAMG